MRQPKKLITQIEDDLHQHFCRKVGRLCHDTASTCELGGLDAHTTVSLIVSGLMYELLRATYALDMNKRDFLVMCNTGYDHMKDCINERKENG